MSVWYESPWVWISMIVIVALFPWLAFAILVGLSLWEASHG